MSSSSKPRVVRKHKSKKFYSKWNYRNALPFLLGDFDQRCAYSMIHAKQVGEGAMHVDHHNPNLKRRSPYTNLYPAYSICNQSKGDDWPSSLDEERYLDPCAETDYDEQIFEDPTNHYLVGTNAAARYHILMLDLNNPALVHHREERANLWALFNRPGICKPGSPTREADASEIGLTLLEILRTKIPVIKPPPVEVAV